MDRRPLNRSTNGPAASWPTILVRFHPGAGRDTRRTGIRLRDCGDRVVGASALRAGDDPPRFAIPVLDQTRSHRPNVAREEPGRLLGARRPVLERPAFGTTLTGLVPRVRRILASR